MEMLPSAPANLCNSPSVAWFGGWFKTFHDCYLWFGSFRRLCISLNCFVMWRMHIMVTTADFAKSMPQGIHHRTEYCMLSHAIQCYWRFESPGWTFQWRKFMRNDAQLGQRMAKVEVFLEPWAIQNSWLPKGAPCHKSWWAHGSPAGGAEMQINSVNRCAMSPAVTAVLFEQQHDVHFEP